jgi:hypothetical protein
MTKHAIHAFPYTPPHESDEQCRRGMSLRDYFAAKAMHALVTEPKWSDYASACVQSWSEDFIATNNPCDRFAFAAYQMADAMLKARND